MNEQRDMAKQVEDRAQQLLAGTGEESHWKNVDAYFVKECLDGNERGDGVLFSTMHRDRFLKNVSHKDGEWYFWDEHVWERDSFDQAINAVEDCAIEYAMQRDQLSEDIKKDSIEKGHKDYWKVALRDKYDNRVNRLRSKSGVEKVLFFAGVVEPGMCCKESDFNTKPMLLPAPNGVIDLTTGELTRGCPADRMNKRIPVEYDRFADYSLWHDTLCEICNSEEIAAFLKRSFGYAITGHSFEQYIWLFLGPGRNGKGIMFNLLKEVIGPFFHEINRAMLIEQRNPPSPNSASEHLYSLLGKRIVVGSETNKGQKIDAAAVKELTGEDAINCRPVFHSEINFDPTHTLMIRTNHVPLGMTQDFAMVQRLLLIDFPFRYVDDVEAEKRKYPVFAEMFRQKDKHLKDKLRLIKPGILRWLVEGCLEWQQRGLDPPAAVTKAVDDLAVENDYLGQFITDCLRHIPGDDCRLPCTGGLSDTFEWWWSENMDAKEQRVPALRVITKGLRERGYQVEKVGGKTYVFDMVINLDVIGDVNEYLERKRK